MPFRKLNPLKSVVEDEKQGSNSKHRNGSTTSALLRKQHLTLATTSTKIRLAILATAMVDALGGPPEFHKRFSFPLVTSMIPNHTFMLPPGVWTDDTSMTLCLARSLATYTPKDDSRPSVKRKGGFNEEDQLRAYADWHIKGVLSAIGRCFDIGSTILQALSLYSCSTIDGLSIQDVLFRIEADLSGENCAGNGSLMRILPVGLAYWQDEKVARAYARRSSMTTHPNLLCQEACEVWTGAIVQIMQANYSRDEEFTKLNLIKYIAEFPYTCTKLREALALPTGIPHCPASKDDQESHYWVHHPILRRISKTPSMKRKGGYSIALPSEDDLPSSGYVLHTLVAALYCFLATETFEEGAIMAVNLGSDADTVGAVYGGMAGTWYSGEKGEDDGMFWSSRVRDWREKLVKRDLVEEIADELAEFSGRIKQENRSSIVS
ncbi:hypothetical protein Hypma_003066 [Hypsizygus marmoreus]|uniref:ADP-ribosylhydrolase ARH3 n=1 Tax=Hypsizygus marmoreus TaxID=39966 RepID=A0A369J946_HYPMA|nr:hypothetical protein Hypma_003066 [Hypsizygus marmoreus]